MRVARERGESGATGGRCLQGGQVFREPVSSYLCRNWNRGRAAAERISDFALVFCRENEGGAGGKPGPAPRLETSHLEFTAP